MVFLANNQSPEVLRCKSQKPSEQFALSGSIFRWPFSRLLVDCFCLYQRFLWGVFPDSDSLDEADRNHSDGANHPDQIGVHPLMYKVFFQKHVLKNSSSSVRLDRSTKPLVLRLPTFVVRCSISLSSRKISYKWIMGRSLLCANFQLMTP